MSDLENQNGLSEDRVLFYERDMTRQKASDYYTGVKTYWVCASILCFISLVLVCITFLTSLSRNAESELNMVRIDGLTFYETRDERRDILMNAALNKKRLNEQGQVVNEDE